MNKKLTVDEFLSQNNFPDSLSGGTLRYALTEFAKLKVDEAKKEIIKKAKVYDYKSDTKRKHFVTEEGTFIVDEDSILKAYPLTNIV